MQRKTKLKKRFNRSAEIPGFQAGNECAKITPRDSKESGGTSPVEFFEFRRVPRSIGKLSSPEITKRFRRFNPGNVLHFTGRENFSIFNESESYRDTSGFRPRRFITGSLLEPVLAALFLVVVIVGLLEAYIYWLSVNETTNALTISISETQGKLEEIRNHAFEDIAQDYGPGGNPGNIFNLTQINGAGVINITSINPELMGVDISVSCKTARNRIIGEDQDLDGLLDLGEDNNGNGKLDSPVSLVSLITQR